MTTPNSLKKTTGSKVKKKQKEDFRFVLSGRGEFVFISPQLQSLWGIDAQDNITQSPQSMITFADEDEAFDDRVLFYAGPHGHIDEQHEENDDDKSLWARSIRSGCHSLLCGAEEKLVDFQCDWISKGDESYLIASGPASPNIPQSEERMRTFLQQALKHNNAGKAVNDQPQEALSDAPSSKRMPNPPVSARLKLEEIIHFADMSRDIMCTAHLDGSLIRINRSFEEILGFQPESLIGKSFMDFVYDEDRPLVRNAFYELGYSAAPAEDIDKIMRDIDVEARMKCAEGAEQDFRWIRWHIRKEENGFYCLGSDMTAVKTNQAQLAARQSELEEAQALARMGHWRWAVGSDRIEWSDELYTVFGYEKGAFDTTIDNVNKLIPREDLARLYQAFQRAIIQQNDYDMVFRANRLNGEPCFIHCEGRCDIDHEGDVVALYGIMQDVTQQMQQEQDLRAAKDAAEAAYASKSRFLANMSHELRTPLNAIIGFSEMMEHQLLGPLGNHKYLDYVSGIRQSGQHLLDLIGDILDMSKIEAGKYELDLEGVSIGKTIRMALHMMEGRAAEGQVKLSFIEHDVAAEDENAQGEGEADISIEADRRAIMQILLNLLSNAVKFTPEKGDVSAGWAWHEDGKSIALTVRDTGVGIPKDKLANVLLPFEQAAHEHTRDHEGSGLGLTITKELVEMHGGTLKIASDLDQGTEVRVILPITQGG